MIESVSLDGLHQLLRPLPIGEFRLLLVPVRSKLTQHRLQFFLLHRFHALHSNVCFQKLRGRLPLGFHVEPIPRARARRERFFTRYQRCVGLCVFSPENTCRDRRLFCCRFVMDTGLRPVGFLSGFTCRVSVGLFLGGITPCRFGQEKKQLFPPASNLGKANILPRQPLRRSPHFRLARCSGVLQPRVRLHIQPLPHTLPIDARAFASTHPPSRKIHTSPQLEVQTPHQPREPHQRRLLFVIELNRRHRPPHSSRPDPPESPFCGHPGTLATATHCGRCAPRTAPHPDARRSRSCAHHAPAAARLRRSGHDALRYRSSIPAITSPNFACSSSSVPLLPITTSPAFTSIPASLTCSATGGASWR